MQRLFVRMLVGLVALVSAAGTVRAGRYESLTKWAAGGPLMKPVSATFFGGKSEEGFISAMELKDGTVAVFGNAYGPDFPATPVPVPLGRHQHTGSQAVYTQTKRKKGGAVSRKLMHEYTVDKAGFIVFYAPGLQEIRKVVKFGWGVATIEAVAAGADGRAAIISGYCSDTLKDVARKAGRFSEAARPAPASEADKGKRRRFRRAPQDKTIYVMRLDTVTLKIDWCWILRNYEAAPKLLFCDSEDNVYFAMHGLERISRDGAARAVISDSGTERGRGQAGYLGVAADGKAYYYGGDRNTNTGYQPWRQPYLYKVDMKANSRLWTLWEWSPKSCACGGKGNWLCSDSSPRVLDFAPNGDLLVVGWSDGGNSVFTRQPSNIRLGAGKPSSPFSTSGMKSANSLAYIMRINGETKRQVAWTYFVSYVPDSFESVKHRGAPNAASIKSLAVTANNSIAFCGKAATGLIQTPGAFWTMPKDYAGKYGGWFAAVFDPTMNALMFSSYLPGYDGADVVPVKNGVLVVGRARAGDGGNSQHGLKPTPAPTLEAVQPKHGGGQTDAHAILLEMPNASVLDKHMAAVLEKRKVEAAREAERRARAQAAKPTFDRDGDGVYSKEERKAMKEEIQGLAPDIDALDDL